MNAVVLCVLVCVCVAVAHPHRKPRSPEEKKNDGGWSVGADKTRGGGTVVKADGQKKWDSNDGKVQAEVHGHWDRTYGGPNNGNRNHGYGGSIGGSWGK